MTLYMPWIRPQLTYVFHCFLGHNSAREKGAVKVDTLLDLHGNIPTFLHISDRKLHDLNILDLLPLEAGAFYNMDRAYLDFERLYRMSLCGIFFVLRAK